MEQVWGNRQTIKLYLYNQIFQLPTNIYETYNWEFSYLLEGGSTWKGYYKEARKDSSCEFNWFRGKRKEGEE